MISSVPPRPVTPGRMSAVLGTPPPEPVHMAKPGLSWPCHQTHGGRDRSQTSKYRKVRQRQVTKAEGPGKELEEAEQRGEEGGNEVRALSPRLDAPRKAGGWGHRTDPVSTSWWAAEDMHALFRVGLQAGRRVTYLRWRSLSTSLPVWRP